MMYVAEGIVISAAFVLLAVNAAILKDYLRQFAFAGFVLYVKTFAVFEYIPDAFSRLITLAEDIKNVIKSYNRTFLNVFTYNGADFNGVSLPHISVQVG
ncbi:hypothetical protein FACS1894188_10260 [Clostridia bacterium]|nr:hypothetical protein FACS1894188_10260 [Clostridia bacterium]